MLTYVVPPEREEEGAEEGKRPDVFVGDMVEGVRDGHGVYTWSNGASYSGPYAVGKKHGKDGHLTLPDGASYKGTFVNGTIAGEGLMRYKNGVPLLLAFDEVSRCAVARPVIPAGTWWHVRVIGPA